MIDRLRDRLRHVDSFGRSLAAIAAIGLIFRWMYILTVKSGIDTCGRELCGDAFYYSSSANVFMHGHGFEDRISDSSHFMPAADHPPLTTIFMAPTNLVFWRHSVIAQRLGMAVLGVAVIVLIGLLTRRLVGPRAGLIVAGLAALNPNFWMNDVLVMSETIGTLMIVLVLISLYRFIDEPSVRRAAVVGVACGFAGLARAELLLFIPITVAPIMLFTQSVKVPARFGRLLASGGAALLVLAPWTMYNLTRFERPVLLSTNDGITLLGANCDEVYGVKDPGGVGFWNLGCIWAVADAIPPGADQSVVSQVYRDAGVDYIKTHKSLVPGVVAMRLGRGWGFAAPAEMVWLNQGEGRESWASWLGYVMWWLLLFPAGAGLVVLRRRKVPIWPLASAFVIVTITLTAFYGIVRFRLPADVAATILAAIGFDAFVSRLRPTASVALPDESGPSDVHMGPTFTTAAVSI